MLIFLETHFSQIVFGLLPEALEQVLPNTLPTANSEGYKPLGDYLGLQITKSEFSVLSTVSLLPRFATHTSPKSFFFSMSDQLLLSDCSLHQSLMFPSLFPRRKSALSLTHCNVWPPQVECLSHGAKIVSSPHPLFCDSTQSIPRIQPLSETFLYLFEDYPSLKVILNINDKIYISRRQNP